MFQFYSRNFKDSDLDIPKDDIRRTSISMAIQFAKEHSKDTGEVTKVTRYGLEIARILLDAVVWTEQYPEFQERYKAAIHANDIERMKD